MFFKQAQLMTQIHATPSKRPVPLGTRQGMANTEPQAPAKAAPHPDSGCASPVTKKAKGVGKGSGVAASAAAKKRALKRL